ncbi:hypothetical protein AB1L05_17715 [Cytobacillus horneckiae]|uniref:hypothetical protein n=1 Tax=Cytobacillus horneckiae TaxID=549687 RepID=UPI0039A06337
MRKIILYISTILLFGIAVIYGMGNFKKETSSLEKEVDENFVNFEGKVDGFYSLNDLEEGSEIIVKGIKRDEIGTEVINSKIDGEVVGGYTISNFEITEVYKNAPDNQKIKIDNTIKVSEVSFYDEQTETNYTVNGYQKMEQSDEYLLLLSDEIEGFFSTTGVTFGKVPLSTDELEIIEDEDSPEHNNIDVFSEIFDDARKKYE